MNGVNKDGGYLVNMCSESGLFLANTFFQYKMIHWYVWRRNVGSKEHRNLIDNMGIDESKICQLKS